MVKFKKMTALLAYFDQEFEDLIIVETGNTINSIRKILKIHFIELIK